MMKEFDSVEFQRKRRAQLSKVLSGLNPEEIVNYFKANTTGKNNKDRLHRFESTSSQSATVREEEKNIQGKNRLLI